MINRVTIMVLDSLGIGAMPDAGKYGDAGADTLGHILDNYALKIPNLRNLGLGNITGAAAGRLAVSKPSGVFGRFAEESEGKDTITGHWEIAGLYTTEPFKTYPDGFPQELMEKFTEATGYGYLGNCPASGTEIIERLGEEHEMTGKVIVYTSADSVFQIAANTEIVPLEELYRICGIARGLLKGQFACGRVIARPYIIENGKRVRTSDRKDYAVSPPAATMLDLVKQAGKEVCAIGKISDIFNGQGVTEAIHTESNDDGITKTIETLGRDFGGMIFTNLVDFDSKFGHRRDPEGYGRAIEEFDRRLPEIMDAMGEEDILIMCSDHGNDPVHSGWNHTREYIFGLLAGAQVKQGVDLGTRDSFADMGATVVDILTDGKSKTQIGKSFRKEALE
ncbi:MAG: phosphopentomutase [Bacillota bacterium]|nr:phosphopentomutase [Bacillota bacterium]